MALSSGLSKQQGRGIRSQCVSRRPAATVRCSVFSAKSAAQRSAEVGREWLESILARFGPATDKAQNLATLDFEKPLLELDKRIKEVGTLGTVHWGQALCRARRLRRAHTFTVDAGSKSC